MGYRFVVLLHALCDMLAYQTTRLGYVFVVLTLYSLVHDASALDTRESGPYKIINQIVVWDGTGHACGVAGVPSLPLL